MHSSWSAKWRRCDDWTLQTFARYYYQSVLAWPDERGCGGGVWRLMRPGADAVAGVDAGGDGDGPDGDACVDW